MTRIRLFAAAALLPAAIGIGAWTIPHGSAAEPSPSERPKPTLPSETQGPGTQNDSVNQSSTFVVRNPKATAEQVLEWRKKYPFRSLAGRLDYEAERAPKSSPPMTPEVEQALKEAAASTTLRTYSFKLLHEEKVEQFVARSGFGVGRSEVNLGERSPMYYELPEVASIPLARVPEGSNVGPTFELPTTRDSARATGGTANMMPTTADMQGLHQAGMSSFVDLSSLGYARSIDQVVGFSSHKFRRNVSGPIDLAQLAAPQAGPQAGRPDAKAPEKHWKLVRLELTSLLKHATPRVYLSENLPRLEDLSSTRTRELSKFETESLAKLHAGEEVITAATANRIEMFGALRASENCRSCHEVPQGTVLGAFSYELRRDPPVKDVSPVSAVQ